MQKRTLIPLLLFAATARFALAQDELPTTAQLQSFQLAVVTPGPPAPFYVDYQPGGCPAMIPACLGGLDLKPGSVVVIRSRHASLAQVTSAGVSGRFLPVKRLRVLPTPSQLPSSAWIGMWRAYGDSLHIRAGTAGRLHVSGNAIWQGANHNDHFGEFEASATPRNNTLELAQDPTHLTGCRVDLVLLGKILYVEDNGFCGGMNVRFDGFYRRSAPAAGKRP